MAIRYRALHLCVADGSRELREIEADEVVGVVDFAWRLGDRGAVHTVMGSGPLGGSLIPGSNRLVFCGHSPVWDTFYPSTMGGAGLPWDGVGANFLVLSGRAPQPVTICLKHVRGALEVEVEPVDPVPIWRDGHAGEIGLYALMHWVFDRHARECLSARVLAVGPAAARTRCGAIGSAPVRKGEITHIDTWAGRGGLGSRLLQHHNVAAVVYGGDYEDRDLTDRKYADSFFEAAHGKPMKLVDLEKTTKYRFDPRFKTGGTFGSNYHALRERALGFNYRTIYLGDAARTRIHERLIAGHYLKQFDDEVVAQKKNENCGEPCAAVCKKVDGIYKKDYEPYQALGPLVGVYDQRAAEPLNRYADAMGFDAIQVGGEVAWVMECLASGWLGTAETGIAERPRWDPDAMDAVADGAHNAAIARRAIAWLLDDERAAPLRRGLRAAARALGGAAAEAAVYGANGDGDGCVVPNQYWVPGMFAPVPILGRYYLDYSYEWQPPRELGRSCGVRMQRELMLDNYAMCRFHRGWAEDLLPVIVDHFHGLGRDAEAHHLALARALNGFNRARPWETERVVDLVHTYLHKVKDDGPTEPALDAWVDRFDRDKRAAALAYWGEMKVGIEDVLGAAG